MVTILSCAHLNPLHHFYVPQGCGRLSFLVLFHRCISFWPPPCAVGGLLFVFVRQPRYSNPTASCLINT
jgi:hypothetical protein